MMPRIGLSRIATKLPHTAQMFNLRYIVPAAVLTRFLVAATRAEVNLPLSSRKIDLTKQEKYSSFFQRVFVEVFGTMAQVASMHLVQDAVSRMFQSSYLKLPNAHNLKELSREERRIISNAIKKEYGSPKNIIAKFMYDWNTVRDNVSSVRRKVFDALKKSGRTFHSEKINHAINKALMGYKRKLMIASATTFGIGVLSGAFVAGYLIQWLNDNVMTPKVIPWIERKVLNFPTTTGNTLFSHPSIKERTFRI